MAYQFPPDVEKLVRQQMVAGGYSSEDDVLRDALRTLGQFEHSAEIARDEFSQTVAAVREGLADADSGRMRSLRELLDEVRDGGSE